MDAAWNTGVVPRRLSATENLCCVDRVVHGPGEGNADEAQNAAAFAPDAKPMCDPVDVAVFALAAAISRLFRGHISLVDRPTGVTNQSDNEHARQNVQRVVVEVVTWYTSREPRRGCS
jgi:hypothetical protein